MPHQNKRRQTKAAEPKDAAREVELPITHKESAFRKIREDCKRRIETFELTREEYDLLRIPSPERKTAWHWELDRECGDGEVPYLRLSSATRTAINEAKHPGQLAVEEVHLGQIKDVIRKDDPYLCRYLEVAHLLRIDWSQPKSKILADFKRWVDSKPVHFLQSKYASGFVEARGKRQDYRAWLRDLGIYRISLRKKYKNSQEFYHLLYGKRWPSQSEWLDAIKRSKRRIEDNVEVLVIFEEYFALKIKGIIPWD